MVDQLIAGAENLIPARIEYARNAGLSPRVGATYREPNSPWRFVTHTMEAPEDDPDTPNLDEGWELPQLKQYIIRHRTPPHLWAAPEHDWVGQTVPLTLSAYALRHERNDPETNHMHAVQLELLAYARDRPYIEWADWVGRRVLGPIVDAGVPININIIARSDGADAYGERGSVRFTWDEWAAYNGVCGHQNVPGNSHWDPGYADYLTMTRAANGAPVPVPIQLQEPDQMIILERNDVVGHAPWLVGGGPPRKLTPTERTAYRSLKGADGEPLVPKCGVNHEQLMLILNSEAKRFDIELSEVD